MVNDKETIQYNNMSISQANQNNCIARARNKKGQYFRQYDAPISNEKCLQTVTSFNKVLHIDINQIKTKNII